MNLPPPSDEPKLNRRRRWKYPRMGVVARQAMRRFAGQDAKTRQAWRGTRLSLDPTREYSPSRPPILGLQDRSIHEDAGAGLGVNSGGAFRADRANGGGQVPAFQPFMVRKRGDDWQQFSFTGKAAVNRSGEYRPGKNAFWRHGECAGQQPLQHNPRRQREIPAGAGS